GGGVSVHGYTDDTAQKLTLINAVIRDNTADGLGGGYAGCPFSTNSIVSTEATAIAIFDNSAEGKSWSKNSDDSATPEDDTAIAAFKAGKFNTFEDVYVAKAGNVNGYMVGGGDENYIGEVLTNDKSPYSSTLIEINGYDSVKMDNQFGLTSRASEADKAAANSNAGVLIAYNHSYVHGGGVLNNSTLVVAQNPPTPSKPYPITFKKFKEDGKTLLSGAELEVYDSDNEMVASWTSDSAAHIQMFVPGTYTLKEKNPPSGYAKAADVTFTIDNNGKVKINNKEVTEVTMKDEKVVLGNLKITKTIKGDVTEAEAEGALVFKVTGPAYEKTFTLKEFTHQKETKTYTLELKDIPTGAYTV
ncbi:MAG: hypothetical protein HUJ76_13350, partial [Parasporobacterium sp.]|nr:hypothetical protein [Parasporobacterium sp.]